MFHLPQTVSHRCLSLVVALVLMAAPVRGESRSAVVKVDLLNVRAQPTVNGHLLGTLSKGARVAVLDRQSGWIKAAFGDSSGYLCDREAYVRVVAAPSAAEANGFQRQAEQIDRQLAAGKAEMAKITMAERAEIAQLEEVDCRLNVSRRELDGMRRELKELVGRIAVNREAIADLEREKRHTAHLAASRIAALYKLHWLGRVQVLAAAPTMNDFLQRQGALRRILDADEKTLERLARQRSKLETLTADQVAHVRQQESLVAEIDTRLRSLNGERNRRQRLLDEIRSRKSLRLAAIEALQQAAKKLDAAIHELGPQLEEKAQNDAPRLPFEARKGLLSFPVKGKIIQLFGPYRNPQFNVMNFRGGIDIQADRGDPIQAVHRGRVLYADWFTGYGNMMIIDHGDAYYTVYAHAEALFKKKGAAVEAGEVIATVGDTGSLEGAVLHFEIRHHGKPIDPLGWLQTG